MNKLELLKKQLELANTEYHEYKKRYYEFINKNDWDEIYDHMCERSMSSHLLTLDEKRAEIKQEIETINLER